MHIEITLLLSVFEEIQDDFRYDLVVVMRYDILFRQSHQIQHGLMRRCNYVRGTYEDIYGLYGDR